MAFKFIVKHEEVEGADPNQTEIPDVPKAKTHKKFTPVAGADDLSAIMRFASTVLVDKYPKSDSLVLYAKEKGSEIEMDRWKCSAPLPGRDKVAKA